MDIYIPTTKRSKRQITWSLIPSTTKHKVCLVVPNNEIEDYDWIPTQIIGLEERGIMATRQAILNYQIGRQKEQPKFCMLDDDLTFHVRSEDGKKFKRCTPDEVECMLDEIERNLLISAHVGLCEKFMSQSQPRGSTISRYYHVLAYNLDLFPPNTPRFRLEIAEDLDFDMQLRSQGCLPCVLTEYTKTDTSHAEGGCATWRTFEIENRVHYQLAKLWPGKIKILPPGSHPKFPQLTKLRISWTKFNKMANDYSNLHTK
jgi:hypothetical protein